MPCDGRSQGESCSALHSFRFDLYLIGEAREKAPLLCLVPGLTSISEAAHLDLQQELLVEASWFECQGWSTAL